MITAPSCVVLTAVTAAIAAAPSSPPPQSPGLWPEYLYNGINRPVIVDVVSPRSFGAVTLVLMDHAGKQLADPIEVHPGRVDLAETLPQIWDIRRAAYLQMLDLQQPVGSALVLQPMLSRLVPVTESATRTNGTTYSRIVRWVDENQPADPPPPPPNSNQDGAQATSAQPPTAPATAPDRAAPVPRLCTGLRIYPENDIILHTSKGDIRIALRSDEAPNTAWNFRELSRGGFYRDILFHRVVPLTGSTPPYPFVIQAGDPTATGDGGPGYWLPIEESNLPHDFGVISMARSDDPDSNGSQFFIALSREGTARLDGQYCSFGYAVDGAQTIQAIADVELADVAAGRPVDPPVINSAELIPAPPRTPNQGRPDQRVTPESKPTPTRPSGRIPR
ncbi:MAG: peptidylprolyl isomerase [Phycisphaerales bacterium]|nr:peptidylprolyl isomerase [Phycisphaerales bacterium]